MNLFVCIDDTDNLESIGTGELLENMMREAAVRPDRRSDRVYVP